MAKRKVTRVRRWTKRVARGSPEMLASEMMSGIYPTMTRNEWMGGAYEKLIANQNLVEGMSEAQPVLEQETAQHPTQVSAGFMMK